MKIRQDCTFILPTGEEIKMSDVISVYLSLIKDNKLSGDEKVLFNLRKRREEECFSVVNRGKLWYNNLTSEQYYQLKKWYNDWLDVTITRVPPIKPDWIDKKLEGEVIL